MARLDEGDDASFYCVARFAQHTDYGFRARLSALYAALLPRGARVLDLCGSFDSHLPPQQQLGRVVGHGMNEAELAANTALGGYFVQDLNADPKLPLADASADAVLCCQGVMYLRRPVEVLREARRVLAPGGRVVIAFSGHCFASKAVAEWLRRDVRGRQQLVEGYLTAAGFERVRCELRQPHAPAPGEEAPAPSSDVFCAVTAVRPVDGGSGDTASAPDAFRTLASDALDAQVQLQLQIGSPVDAKVLDGWRAAYGQMAVEARGLGIPRSAVPELPPDADADAMRAARKRLGDMIASFMSSGL